MTDNKVFLQINNLEKIYPNGEKAVYNFNLDIEKNEFIVIVGPSGCGKSTTLRMIAGLEDISAGQVFMDGELLNYKPCKDRKMAIVFQSYALYPQMSVYENIAFPLTINKYPFPAVREKLLAVSQLRSLLNEISVQRLSEALSDIERVKGIRAAERLAIKLSVCYEAAKILLSLGRDFSESELCARLDEIEIAEKQELGNAGIEINSDFCELDENGKPKTVVRRMTPFEISVKVFETADILDLTDYLDKIPKELSGGQMQRVALGRAIVKNVPVFLMDEPLSNLDAKLRLVMRSEIVKLHNRINATTLYVTHDQTEAMTMATRIVVMSRGFVQQIGTPEEVYNNPVNIFVARFIGSPSMNIFEMDYDRLGGRLCRDDIDIKVGDGFAARYDNFYAAKNSEFKSLLESFDDEAKKHIRKIISATDQQGEKIPSAEPKRKLISALMKKKKTEDAVCRELLTAQEKAAKLAEYTNGGRLYVGIRPERIKIEKYDPNKTYEGGVVMTPVLCELLGAEYNVHFTWCGQNMVGKIDAKEKLSVNDKILVTMSFDDIYVFDPITGEVI